MESLNQKLKPRPANYGKLGVGSGNIERSDPKAFGQHLVGITNASNLHVDDGDGLENEDYGSFAS